MISITRLAVAGAVTAATALGGLAQASTLSPWSLAVRVEDTPGTDPAFNGAALDGCPFESRDGTRLFMASNRPGGLGSLDIWVAQRASADDPWGEPVNLGAPVNSAADDFCPSPARDGHTLLFVSTRAGGCGGADLLISRQQPDGWTEPANPGCAVNSAANEASPYLLFERADGPVVYFSSERAGGFADDPPGASAGDSDIYVSVFDGGELGARCLSAAAAAAPPACPARATRRRRCPS